MLELDYEHRACGTLPPQLRAQMRWVVAHANRCAYGEACAASDFVRAGGAADALLALAGIPEQLPQAQRAALAFARKLTVSAHGVTDEEVARLVECYGDRQVVAMTLLVAYANFLDRLVLTLDLGAGEEGFAPLEVRFAPLPLGADRSAPPRQGPATPAKGEVASPANDPEWLALNIDILHENVALQRCQRPRLPLPAVDSEAINWGLVCRTYQPRLADVWAACKQAFGAEADQDQVFEASLFWVVTRTQRSFY
jgi:hypothetical protein